MPATQLTSTDIIHMLKGFTRLQSKLLVAISLTEWNRFLHYKYCQIGYEQEKHGQGAQDKYSTI